MAHHCKKPCNNCPFVKNTKLVLTNIFTKEQAKNVWDNDTHTCHKTTYLPNAKRKQCAGHILARKEISLYVRMAKVMNVEVNVSTSKGQSIMNENEFFEHHKI